ncbi:hypothetical protein QBC35DRAFT_410987 [Podospora australis]|uniref:N-acetyltransferase domain-containing protein n=1 Tax=Podospora australis TaxID=1536484 RepID=A0AAN6WSK0_9PEZI|nr:hypothetical protein QBC35DRAFT_410987 [Podospora australis]
MSPPSDQIKSWTLEVAGVTYAVSTDSSLVQLDALNAAFHSDMLYWAKPLSEENLKRCVDLSLCFGLYLPSGQMVGFARVVTDYVTFGYLTDVYVEKEHQRKGLAKFLMKCLDEVLVSWPDLRRCLILTKDEDAARLYKGILGARDLSETSTAGLIKLEVPGSANKLT